MSTLKLKKFTLFFVAWVREGIIGFDKVIVGTVKAEGSISNKTKEGGFVDIELNVIKQHGSYIVTRPGMAHEFHAHLSTHNGCRTLMRCIKYSKMPYSKYLVESCHRLLTEEEFKKLRANKSRYYNANGGRHKQTANMR